MDVGVDCELQSVVSESSALVFQTPSPTVSFHKLHYCVKERGGMFSWKWVEKEILKNVRLVVLCLHIGVLVI